MSKSPKKQHNIIKFIKNDKNWKRIDKKYHFYIVNNILSCHHRRYNFKLYRNMKGNN